MTWVVVDHWRRPTLDNPHPVTWPAGVTEHSFAATNEDVWYLVQAKTAAARLALINDLNSLPCPHDPDDCDRQTCKVRIVRFDTEVAHFESGCGQTWSERYDESEGWLTPLRTFKTKTEALGYMDDTSMSKFLGL
jgi:hypothetical protein